MIIQVDAEVLKQCFGDFASACAVKRIEQESREVGFEKVPDVFVVLPGERCEAFYVRTES